MSNISKDKKIDELSQLFSQFGDELTNKLYTAIPAVIQSFDAEKRRCTILLGTKRELSDGTIRDIQQLLNVPVIFPASQEFTIFMPLKKGDAVMAIFSHRGIENFKLNFEIAQASNNSVMSIDSAVVIAGFGAISITPADSSSASMQTSDGTNAIILNKDQIQLKVGSATATLTSSLFSSSVPISAPDFTANGVSLKTHVHGGVTTGSDPTGVPL